MTQAIAYDADYLHWLDGQASLLRAGAFDRLDREHLVEELESMSRSERRGLDHPLVQCC